MGETLQLILQPMKNLKKLKLVETSVPQAILSSIRRRRIRVIYVPKKGLKQEGGFAIDLDEYFPELVV